MWKWSHGHESDPHWLSSWHKVGGPWHHAWRESCYNVVEFICTGHGLHRMNPSTYTVSSWWTQPIAQSVCQPIRTLESGLMQCLLLERSNHGAEIGGGRDFVTSSCGALSDNFLRARECLCVFLCASHQSSWRSRDEIHKESPSTSSNWTVMCWQSHRKNCLLLCWCCNWLMMLLFSAQIQWIVFKIRNMHYWVAKRFKLCRNHSTVYNVSQKKIWKRS